MFQELDTVVLIHDINEYGLEQGDIGAVTHCYKDGAAFEVEFITADGRTIALLTLNQTDRFAHVIIREVVDVDRFRLHLWAQFPSRVLVVTHQLFFLCIHGDGWGSPLQLTADRLIDMLELGISVWMPSIKTHSHSFLGINQSEYKVLIRGATIGLSWQI